MFWFSCGLKIINGVQRIGAAGFETEKVPGMTQGGMVWPNRFKTFCNALLEDFEDEWQVYKLYREAADKLVYTMCYAGKEKSCVKHPTPLVPRKTNDEL